MSNSIQPDGSQSSVSADVPVVPTPTSGDSKVQEKAQLEELEERVNNWVVDDLDRESERVPHYTKSQEETKRLAEDIEGLKRVLGIMHHEYGSASRLLSLPSVIGFWDPDCATDSTSPVGYIVEEERRHFFKVEQFVESLQAAASMMPSNLICHTLPFCFLGSARTWYNSVLTKSQQREAVQGDDIGNWVVLLRKRWGLSTDKAFERLTALNLSREAYDKGQITDFVLEVVRIGRQLGMETTYSQLVLAYSRFSKDVLPLVSPPKENDSVDDFTKRISKS
ncbi:hypothetical protein IWZ01DRAFT_544808 [Phyllosticta capitalensis]